jgi:peptidoglycan/xylan/chitin deacetylase (PgdA/CDA1 family)
MKSNGYFLISLDFELQWGRFDKVILDDARKKELENTLELVPQMLKLFEENEISVTWAVVGMLFNKSREEWISNIPKLIPNYTNQKLSPYLYFNFLKSDETLNKYFFAQELIDLILNAKKQELASHTYSHYYCLEEGQSIECFKTDLETVKSISNKMKSLVLPRNQFNINYHSVCKTLEFSTIRTNPSSWYWEANKDNLLKRLFRLIDTFNLFTYNKCIHPDFFKKQNTFPYFLPSSRFLRSWMPRNKIINYIKLLRIKFEMTYAARYKKYYHIWWHPENFGNHPIECFNELKMIIQHYLKLQKKYGFKSVTMSEFGEIIKANNAHNS